MPWPCTSPRPGRRTRTSPPTWTSTGRRCVSGCCGTGTPWHRARGRPASRDGAGPTRTTGRLQRSRRADPAVGGPGGRAWGERAEAGHRAGHPARGDQVFRRRDEPVSRFQFVHDHRDAYEVRRLCQVLDVNRSSYCEWLGGVEARAVHRREDQVLAERIRRIHADPGGAYGSPRVTAELRETGTRVNHKRVARLMRTYSIVGIRLRRRVRTTVPDPASAVVADLFERDFTAPEPGRKYMGDITYLPLADGEFTHQTTVLDCFSRKVVGWSTADHMRTGPVADALRMAAQTRGSMDGSVFHSDHRARYGSRVLADLCSDLGVTRSMGAVGSSCEMGQRTALKRRAALSLGSPAAGSATHSDGTPGRRGREVDPTLTAGGLPE
ncbi:IS3 family transposase [Kitasatospora cineracea]|uniref:IS3 family transposase n=1 Tax=Kitasatospora cineracea TaxID=88074 RepID=UPI00379F289D